jgi:peptide methionine sulfoxide reductase MsrA
VTDAAGRKLRLSPEVAARNQAAAEQYRREMEAYAKAQSEHARKIAQHMDNTRTAAQARQEHERQLAVNAAQVAANQAAQEEYKKALAKPAGVNSVYRGFNGPTCEIARNSAVRGSGTDKGSQFKEVTYVLSDNPRQCIVQGWSWTTRKTGSSRQ